MSEYSIMIVDHDTANTDFVLRTLTLAGYRHVDTYADGATAYEMFKTKKYHIMLAEIGMPQTDGIDFLKKVRAYDPLTQVIVMAGRSTLDTILTCLELGVNAYLRKPFESGEAILAAVEEAIKKLESWREAIKGIVAKG